MNDGPDSRLPPVRVEYTAAQHVASAVGGKCATCARSLCCRYITQEIDTPRSRYDFDHLVWQLSHQNVSLFKDEDGWYLIIDSACINLQADGSCGIYETRPWICREHSNEYCDLDAPLDETADLFFANAAALEVYCRKRFKSWDRRFKDWEREPPV